MKRAVYIHIPFCRNICSYCDFCKMYYNEKMVNDYLEALKKEIEEVYQKDQIKTIYIGGGTPSVLTLEQLKKLFSLLKIFPKEELEEFTIEMNPEDITEEKLQLFSENKVTRISIGHQTKHLKYRKELNRTSIVTKEQIKLVKKYFQNVNVDLMYGFQKETKEELLEDISYLLELQVPHISTYSLILEEHTKLYINSYKRLEEDIDAEFYSFLQDILEKNGYHQYEISNFAKEEYFSKHNLTYWNNEEYYGFGLGASSYLNSIRSTNTRSINQYLIGNRVLEKEILTKEDKMIYEMILGLRKTEGVEGKSFFEKYGCNIENSFDIIDLENLGYLKKKNGYLYIPKEYLYLENTILIHFLEVVK